MTGRLIKVLIADDQALFRGALATALGLESDIDVVAEVADGPEVVEAALRTQPDVALIDVQMPGRNGLDVAADLRETLPACRVLVCTTFARPGYLQRAVEAGAAGFTAKDSSPEQLADSVRRVHAGLRVIDPIVAQESVLIGPNPLSMREVEVLRAVHRLGTVGEAAQQVHLSEGTVRNYLSSTIGKTGTRTREEAFRIANERGWLD